MQLSKGIYFVASAVFCEYNVTTLTKVGASFWLVIHWSLLDIIVRLESAGEDMNTIF